MTPIMTNVVLDRQSDLAISSLANPSMATRLTDTDNPDHSSSNDRETDIWPVVPKAPLIVLTDHELSMDEYMLEAYSTDTDLDEQVPDEQQQQQQVLDEQQQQQEQQQRPSQMQQQQEEQLDFKMPEKSPPKANKRKKVPLRRQKGRACKSSSKSYIEDFSDDADFE